MINIKGLSERTALFILYMGTILLFFLPPLFNSHPDHMDTHCGYGVGELFTGFDS